MTEKVDITNRYQKDEEVRKDPSPYIAFYKTLSGVFDFQKVKSFCDVGCATGHLINEVKRSFPYCKVRGYEYFQYHKDASPSTITEEIVIHDMRDPISENDKFDIVLCTEVGEHIDPAYTSAFLENLKKLTGKYLIMSWSDSGGEHDRANDPNHQHLNPMKFEQFREMMEQNGFYLLENQTAKLLETSHSNPAFYSWWRKSLSIWRLKNA